MFQYGPLLSMLSVVALAETATGGYVAVQLPFSNPAGITYVNGLEHQKAGLLAGPLRYTAQPGQVPVAATPQLFSYNLPTPVYGRDGGGFQYHSYGTPSVKVYEQRPVVYGPVQPGPTHTVQTVAVVPQYPKPSVHAIVPVHHPVTPVTPVAVPVHPISVPVATPVPVPVTPLVPTYTKTVTTGPTTVVSTAPIPHPPVPVIRSRKFKVRRPAIQNQFYDIEERVIIRPVGSALVELEQPVSQTETRTKTKTLPEHPAYYGYESQTSTDAVFGSRIRKPQITAHQNVYSQGSHSLSSAQGRVEVSTGRSKQQTVTPRSQVEVLNIIPQVTSTTSRPFFAQHTLYHQSPISQYGGQQLFPHPLVFHPSNAGHLLHHVSVLPTYNQYPHVLHYPGTSTVVPVTPTTDCPEKPTAPPTYLPPTPTHPVSSTPAVSTPAPLPTPTAPAPSHDDYDYDDTVVINARGSNSGSSNFSDTTASSVEDYDTTATYNDKYEEDQSSVNTGIEVSYASKATEETSSFRSEIRSQSYAAESSTPVATTTAFPIISTSAPSRSVTIISSTSTRTAAPAARVSIESATSSQPVVISNGQLTPEQARSNQDQFIRLLSERDSIAELGFGPKSDSSGSLIDTYVRSRVLSATPAPRDAKETSRTVNIRRIIVSRPIETEQEVEVREQTFVTPAPSYPDSTEGPSSHAPSLPPFYHQSSKRETSDSSESEEPVTPSVPVYVTAKPPAFATATADNRNN